MRDNDDAAMQGMKPLSSLCVVEWTRAQRVPVVLMLPSHVTPGTMRRWLERRGDVDGMEGRTHPVMVDQRAEETERDAHRDDSQSVDRVLEAVRVTCRRRWAERGWSWAQLSSTHRR